VSVPFFLDEQFAAVDAELAITVTNGDYRIITSIGSIPLQTVARKRLVYDGGVEIGPERRTKICVRQR